MEDIINLLESSPIRKYCKSNPKINFFEKETIFLNTVQDIIKTSYDNLSNPVKVLVLGEIKAGKSTLINSLIEKEIAYTNVVEATSAITEIKYGENDNAIIRYNDGTKDKNISLENLNTLFDKNRNDQSFFKNIERVDISVKTDKIKDIIIVDTPGLNTITEENSNRTENYIKNSDVILWVLNANHLGQTSIREKIEEIQPYGKPILCVINRIDEVDANPDDLQEYVEDDIGYMFEEIFPTSAKLHWDGLQTNNQEILNSSYIKSLHNYIINNIERNSSSVKTNSVNQTINAQLSIEYFIHNAMLKKLQEFKKQLSNSESDIRSFNTRIKTKYDKDIQNWVDHELFRAEENILLNSTSKNYEIKLQNFINQSYINKLVQSEYQNLITNIYSEWNTYFNDIMTKKESTIFIDINLGIIQYDDVSVDENTKHSMLTGLAIGAGGAASFAGIMGFIGGSTTLAIGTMFVVSPPLIISGAAAGALFSLFKNNQSKIDKKRNIDAVVTEVRQTVRVNIMNHLITNIYTVSDNYRDQIISYIDNLLKDSNMTDIDTLIKELLSYILKLSSYTDIKKITN